MEFTLHPIGIIHTPFTTAAATPIQPSRSEASGHVEVFPEYSSGLEDLGEFSHILLIYLFHQTAEFQLLVTPFLDERPRGLFATRYPARPNPLGLSIVGLVKIEANILTIQGADMLDGTPLLDIKPYFPDFDRFPGEARTGWYTQQRHNQRKTAGG